MLRKVLRLLLGWIVTLFQRAPTLGGECYPLCTMLSTMLTSPLDILFQWAPTLGGECYLCIPVRISVGNHEFQWAPTLGGECYRYGSASIISVWAKIQWAPTLGGECYSVPCSPVRDGDIPFQWAPTLGGECYNPTTTATRFLMLGSFNGHPPLGVNATWETGESRSRT